MTKKIQIDKNLGLNIIEEYNDSKARDSFDNGTKKRFKLNIDEKPESIIKKLTYLGNFGKVSTELGFNSTYKLNEKFGFVTYSEIVNTLEETQKRPYEIEISAFYNNKNKEKKLKMENQFFNNIEKILNTKNN